MRIQAEEVLNNPSLVDDIAAALRDGGVIAYPTDTVYGLGCDAYHAEAIETLYDLKKRPRSEPVSVICTDLMDIHRQATIPGFAYQIIKQLLPGPYTFILPRKNPQLKTLLGPNPNIAIRFPKHDLSLVLTKALGHPLVSTSANISGDPVIYFPQLIEDTFGDRLAYLIDDGVLISDPSSLVDLTHDVPRVIREGKGDVSSFL